MPFDSQIPTVRETIKSRDGSITLSLSPTTDTAKVMEGLEACCRGYRKVETVGRAMWIAIGLHLQHIQERKLYRELGYSIFEDFVVLKVDGLFGVKRSTAFKMLRSAKALGGLAPLRELQQIPQGNLDVAARVIRHTKPDREAAVLLLEEAKHKTPGEFKEAHAREAHSTSGVSVIRIPTSRRLATAWQRYCGDRKPEEV